MAQVRVVLNRGNVRALLRSDDVLNDLTQRARRIASAAGDGYEADSDVGANRARASVRTVTVDAMRAETRGHNLLRALDAGR